jgi:hypothetical protein
MIARPSTPVRRRDPLRILAWGLVAIGLVLIVGAPIHVGIRGRQLRAGMDRLFPRIGPDIEATARYRALAQELIRLDAVPGITSGAALAATGAVVLVIRRLRPAAGAGPDRR